MHTNDFLILITQPHHHEHDNHGHGVHEEVSSDKKL